MTERPDEAEVERLRREARILRKQLIRSEANRQRLEDHKERAVGFHRRVIAEMEATQRRLTDSEHRAQQAARVKSEVLANVSHEIRTPMNGVIGMAALLLRTDLDATQRRMAETIAQSSEALMTLIDSVLDLARIEAGRLELHPAELDVRTLFEDAAAVFAEPAYSKNVELICDVENDGLLYADALRLRQVLTNLISNAVKFTRSGHVRVSAKLEDGPGETTTLLGCVEDTGPGLDVTRVERLFSPFEQADGSTTREFGGSGLGLAIVRELVTLMGGELGVTGELGQGARFEFRVPLPRVSDAEEPAPGVPSGFRVRLVVSHRDQETAVVRMLRGAGISPADGGEAVAAVITDSRDVPEHSDDSELPIVHLVAPAQLAKGENLERVTTIGKPVRRHKLLGALEQAVSPQRDPELSVRGANALCLRVLVAEDNIVNREVAIALLEQLGCDAYAVEDGRLAVDAVAREHFDIVLMDCQMPQMDGFEATRAIRDSGVAIPIVALTANVLRRERERCEQVGMNDFLSKPFTPDQLRGVLVKHARANDVVNTSALHELGPPELRQRFLRLYSDQTDELVPELVAAATAVDVEVALRLAHKLKGGSSTVGAARVARLCGEVEEALRSGQQAHGLVSQVRPAVVEFLQKAAS